MPDENTASSQAPAASGADDENRDDKKRASHAGVTGSAARVVRGAADAATGVVGAAQDAAKDALPDAVPDVADKVIDAAARLARSTIDRDAAVVERALHITGAIGRPLRIAAVIVVVAVIAVLIARRR
ncbi:hypothetical protein [Microbacterium oleivorans]|uniref:Uncharacterized protein n=1 Tax=Microbacterium oleivorans TaxID=273677 RepID=A0A7D5IRU2_9MICO|nr:hypothetical protein [Microbacterium oleivorans]QLD10774.1 hypothetical protein HW566_02640 [Microbacterium oleivorans]